ncbi:hypothetical protein FKP32DRAFT_1562917 [Trametes sanguinea]|nr:hypothetical protein FKP32DRAFT_1562917 [Trametes sanguinea]
MSKSSLCHSLTALFCYDYCLTFGREVQLVWRRRFSTSSVLFFGARYPAVFSTIFVIMDMTSWKGMSDWVLHSLFSGLRVYALWDRNTWILAAVLLLGMVNPVISIVGTASLDDRQLPDLFLTSIPSRKWSR